MLKLKPLLSVLATVICVAGCGDDLPMAGEIELTELFTAEFDLIDMNGDPASDERFDGEPLLIYFGFTSCPDVCPAALGVMVATLDAMGNDADKLQPLFITVDPERDTPEVLRNHLAFDPRILGLTGSESELKLARDRMRIFASKVPLENSVVEYTVDHQSLFFFVNSDGTPTHAFDDNTSPQALGKRLKQLIR